MGCYDTVIVPCPLCGRGYGAQSKGGECELATYTIENAPGDVVSDINRHAPFECECGAEFVVRVQYLINVELL